MNPQKWGTNPIWDQERGKEYLLSVFLLDLLQVGSEIHADLVLGAQQSPQHRISRHAHPAQGRPLEFALQVKELQAQVFQLQGNEMRREIERAGHGLLTQTLAAQADTKDGLETPPKDGSGQNSPPC